MLDRYNLLVCDLVAMMSFAIGYKLNGLQSLVLSIPINHHYITPIQSATGLMFTIIGILWFWYREIKIYN